MPITNRNRTFFDLFMGTNPARYGLLTDATKCQRLIAVTRDTIKELKPFCSGN